MRILLNMLVLCALAGAGCRHVQVVHRISGFHSSELISGGLGIGTITGSGGGEYYFASNVAAGFVAALREKCPALSIVTWPETQSILNTNLLASFMNEFSEARTLRGKELELFQPLRTKARYVLLINVSQDSKEITGRGTIHPSRRPDYEDSSFDSSHDPNSFYSYRSGVRDVEIEFFVWDLDQRHPVWMASGSRRKHGSQEIASPVRIRGLRWSATPASVDLIQALSKEAVAKLLD